MSDYELALLKGKKVSRAAALLEMLKARGVKDWQTYFRVVLTLTLALFFILFVLLSYAFPTSAYNLWASLVCAFAVFSILFNLPSYLANRYREELENHLVPALYAAARLPKGTPASKVIARLAGLKEFGLLSEVFQGIDSFYSRASGRYSFGQIFTKYSATIGSAKLERMLEVLNLGLKHNRDANSILLKSAEDLEDVDLLSRQRTSQLFSQKATLILSSGILLPAILSAASRILALLTSAGLGNIAAKDALLNSLLGYTAIEAVFAAVWISLSIEGRKSALALYLPALTLLATAVFLVVGSLL